MKKPLWVADSINYPTTISFIEKAAISTGIFNRLHNVLENSTVYFTFPSNRTSRFVHSIGCMKNAGEIFRISIANADDQSTSKFFSQMKELVTGEIKQLARDGVNYHISDHISRNELEKYDPERLKDLPLYYKSIPGNVIEEDRYFYILAFQAIRLSALFHDLGHPPFSHVVERAIDLLYMELREKLDEGEELNPDQDNFYKDATFFLKRTKRNNAEDKEKKEPAFHEMLGSWLADEIMREIIGDKIAEENCNQYVLFFMYNLRHLVEYILNDKKEVALGLHRIIDGDLDADRIDYVSRDMVASGISRAPHNYDRLIQSYRLLYSDKNIGPHIKDDTPLFVPSVRALSTIEDFFYQRFNLWKYIIFHHRVVKTDALLENTVAELSRDILNNNGGSAASSIHLPADLSGLWKVFRAKEEFRSKETTDHFIQWDDSWLLSVLRNHYFIRHQENEADKSKEGVIDFRLQEIITNRKFYYSLYKRLDTFIQIDNSFVASFEDDFDWIGFAKSLNIIKGDTGSREWNVFSDWLNDVPGTQSVGALLTKRAEKFKILKANVTKIANFLRGEEPEPYPHLREKQGLAIIRFIETLQLSGARLSAGGLRIVREVALRLRDEYDLDDVILTFKQIKPGLNDGFLLERDGKLINIGAVSNIVDLLKRSAELVPPFFVYIFKSGKNFTDEELSDLRIGFGHLLYETLKVYLEERKALI